MGGLTRKALLGGGPSGIPSEVSAILDAGLSGAGATLSAGISGDGKTAVVGAPGDPSMGSVYIFSFAGGRWDLQQTLKSDGSGSSVMFGLSVSVSDDGSVIAVGAPYSDDRGSDTGAVYIFRLGSDSTWAQEAKILPPNWRSSARFGWSVSLSATGDAVSVSAPGYATANAIVRRISNGWNSFYTFSKASPVCALSADSKTMAVKDGGYVRVLHYNSVYQWVDQGTLSPEISEASFGDSIAISEDGNTIAVGAPNKDGTTYAVGTVYIFKRSGSVWGLSSTLTPQVTKAYLKFGAGVSLSADGKVLCVGSSGGGRYSQVTGSSVGLVEIFVEANSKWALRESFYPIEDVSMFGSDVSLSADGSSLLCATKQEKAYILS